jgi:predicted RNA-binding protein associated with RNAse of E/G family
MQLLKFYKDEKKDWYIDFPGWTGRKSALQMVAGADTLLDYIAEGKYEVLLYVDVDEFDGAESLTLISKCWFNGAYYWVDTYKNNYLNLKIWLCNVTKHVLGEFPEKIYYHKYIEYKI